VLVLGSIYYQSPKISLGVILGGFLSLINIKILTRIVENLFHQDIPSKSAIVVQYVVKIVLLFGMLYVVISYKLVNIIAFVVGFSAFLIALLLENIFPSRRSV
jgi:hypothetical protein